MRIYRFLNRNISNLIDTYSNYNPSPMSLKKLTDFGKPIYSKSVEKNLDLINKTEIKSFEFLRQELLVRVASMMKEMLYLPENLVKTSSVQEVYGWYMQSFIDLVEFKDVKNSDSKILKKFTDTLSTIVTRHSEVVPTISLGILQLQETYGIDSKTELSIQYFLDRFFMSRISIRMLINQHVLMFSEDLKNTPAEHIGAIHTNCKVLEVIQDAYDNAKFLCDQYYLCSPDIDIKVENTIEKGKDIEFVYVPSHLYHIVFEIVKNAMRAVIEYHGQTVKSYPKIQVIIVKGKEDVTIRITDHGGGIPQSKLPLVFKYMYSTAPRPSIVANVYTLSSTAPLAGFGYGLPLSRLYARYFNGDLVLSSIDGHSTDAYIYLKTLSSDANESLPVYNRKTVNTYKASSDTSMSDWTETKRKTV